MPDVIMPMIFAQADSVVHASSRKFKNPKPGRENLLNDDFKCSCVGFETPQPTVRTFLEQIGSDRGEVVMPSFQC